jgi:hypothetical protein
LVKIHNEDYICITDMLTAKDGQFFVSDWMRNRNTLEFLGIWEMVNNPTFNCGEFAIVKMKSGLNNFKLSVKEYSSKFNGIGIVSSTNALRGYEHGTPRVFNEGNFVARVYDEGLRRMFFEQMTEVIYSIKTQELQLFE